MGLSVSNVYSALDVPCFTVQKFFRCILHFYPNKIKLVHLSQHVHTEVRKFFALQFLFRIAVDATCPYGIFWGISKPTFFFSGKVNIKNCCAAENPQAIQKQPLHPEKVTV